MDSVQGCACDVDWCMWPRRFCSVLLWCMHGYLGLYTQKFIVFSNPLQAEQKGASSFRCLGGRYRDSRNRLTKTICFCLAEFLRFARGHTICLSLSKSGWFKVCIVPLVALVLEPDHPSFRIKSFACLLSPPAKWAGIALMICETWSSSLHRSQVLTPMRCTQPSGLQQSWVLAFRCLPAAAYLFQE